MKIIFRCCPNCMIYKRNNFIKNKKEIKCKSCNWIGNKEDLKKYIF